MALPGRGGVVWLLLLFAAVPSLGEYPEPYSNPIPSPHTPQSDPAEMDRELNRIMSVGGGVGLPYLIAAQAILVVFPRWHFGVNYGKLPGSWGLAPKFDLPEQRLALVDGLNYHTVPRVVTALTTIAPFIRFFPGPGAFYLQFCYAMVNPSVVIYNDLKGADGLDVPDAAITALVNISQVMPTISIGVVFGGRLLFVDLSLGASILGSISANIQFDAQLPGGVGGTTANLPQIDQLNSTLSQAINEGTEAFRKSVLFVPSVSLFMGLIF